MTMKESIRTTIRRFSAGAPLLGCALLLGMAQAQDTSTSTTQAGQSTVTTQVRSGTVVYVSGNDLVVKLDDGTVKHFVVPDSTRVTVDGRSLSVHQLQQGMKLTRTITTTTTPTNVETVRTISGKVWYVNPPSALILSFPDSPNKQYKVPSGTKFDVNGEKVSIFHIKKGMTISATIITDEPITVASESRSVTGEAPPPPPPPPATPPAEGALLIEEPAAPQQVAESTLPKTASSIPLIGFLGLLSLSAAAGLGALRK
jgi:hypothetical protein